MSSNMKSNVESAESVALSLAADIAQTEELYNDKSNYRKNLLDLYAECLKATSGQRKVSE